ncbi:MAG: hypothetical protein B7X11_01355 [Acidobacteria bacterium 37-65-4]|nr:MAG: hypothetical protein B7X11_01355 [Acidobacteria bacterium 37-65-4]
MTNVSQGAFSVIAERFRRAGQADRAVEVCREGLALYPEHLSARVTLGCALLDLGQDLEAHKELQAVLKRAPDNLAAIRGLAEVHARGGEGQDVEDAQDAQAAHEVMEAEALDAQVAQEVQVAQEAQEAQGQQVALDSPVALGVTEAEGALAMQMADVVQEAAIAPLGEFDDLQSLAFAAPAQLEGLQFEIEDVIASAEDAVAPGFAFQSDLDPCLDLELDPVMDPELDPYMEPQAMSASFPEPVPVPELSARPIAVLDEWLIRVRARRSELLSEYAAG